MHFLFNPYKNNDANCKYYVVFRAERVSLYDLLSLVPTGSDHYEETSSDGVSSQNDHSIYSGKNASI